MNEKFTGQMTWPCVCGHPKSDHYFGDGLGKDGQMHTWCQHHPTECLDFKPRTRTIDQEAKAEAVVKRTSRMGLCSQTHHEHLMLAARAALTSTDKETQTQENPLVGLGPDELESVYIDGIEHARQEGTE